MKVTIIGAGKAGHAAAAHMTKQGFQTSLWDRSAEKIETLKKDNNIHVDGAFSGNFKIHNITHDLSKALEGADLISLMLTSDAYEEIAQKMAPLLVDGQKVLLNCGGVGGTLLFHATLRRAGYQPDIVVGETDTCIYACTSPRIGHSLIKSIKNKMYFTATPLSKANSFLEDINKIYPQFQLVEDPLAIGLWDATCFHTAGIIFNAERISKKEDFNFYIEGITPDIARYMERLDQERVNLTKALGIPTESAREWLHSAYGIPLSDLHTMLQQNKPYKQGSPAPKTFQHRYLLEEVPTKLIPRLEFARVLGVPQPLTTEMADRACELTGINLYAKGRTMKKLGFTEDDILNYSKNGIQPYLKRHMLHETHFQKPEVGAVGG